MDAMLSLRVHDRVAAFDSDMGQMRKGNVVEVFGDAVAVSFDKNTAPVMFPRAHVFLLYRYQKPAAFKGLIPLCFLGKSQMEMAVKAEAEKNAADEWKQD